MCFEYKDTLERQVTQVLNNRIPIQSEWKKNEFRRKRREWGQLHHNSNRNRYDWLSNRSYERSSNIASREFWEI
jgi:hypothetical protein